MSIFKTMMGWGIALISAGPVAADVVAFGEFASAQTRFGMLTTPQVSDWQTVLRMEGYRDPLLEDRWVKILGAYTRPGEDFDWVLVESLHGGNMCPSSYTILKLGAGRLNRTAKFGECLGRLQEVRVLPGRIELQIADPDTRVAHQVFAYDGVQLSQTGAATAAVQGVPGAGADVTRWIGQHPVAALRDPQERNRFAPYLSADLLEDLNVRMSGPGETTRRGNWVVGYACQAHACNVAQGMWAMRISDGLPWVQFYGGSMDRKIFGPQEALSDLELLRIMDSLPR